jgi:lipoyl(octanoyl) transferase
MPDDRAHTAGPGIVRSLGSTRYEPTWRAMQAFTAARGETAPDEIWLTEHPPIYTLGLAGRAQHVRVANGIPVLRVDRGGQVTYHGPGQLVAYVLLNLKRRRLGVRTLVRALEGAVIDWLAGLGVPSHGRVDAPGVYVDASGGEAKIAALGLRVKNGCTYHGISVNIAMDLTPFDDIDPCGFPGMRVTQIEDFTTAPTLIDAGATLAPLLFDRIARAR